MHLEYTCLTDQENLIATNDRLKALLARMTTLEGRSATAVEGLTLTRWDDAATTDVCFYAPAVGVIAQGRKASLIGSASYVYGELDCLVNGVDMPSISKMLEATPDKPILAVSLNIDRSMAIELSASIPPASACVDALGISIARVSLNVLDAFVRLVELLDKPDHIRLRAPLLVREIISRILMGTQGAALRNIYTVGSHSNQVSEAVTWLRENYRLPLHVEALAAHVGMATSTFHRQFKKVTSISPLQYQKCLRLYEAQRLMLTADMDANNAGRAVGYENIQQFNREYKRIFGEPPLRNIKRLLKK